MQFRDLEKVRQIIKEATDLEIAYAYDDLVFPDHMAFIIKYDDRDTSNFYCYFHEDCIENNQKDITKNLNRVAKSMNCSILVDGKFSYKQNGENVELYFN